MPRSVGVGFDASREAQGALAAAAALALAVGASVQVTVVVAPLSYGYRPVWPVAVPNLQRERVDHARGQLDAALASLPSELDAGGRVLEGNPVEVLTDEARELDLLMLGTRGYGLLRGVLLGSVSAELIRVAACPVVVVPRDMRQV